MLRKLVPFAGLAALLTACAALNNPQPAPTAAPPEPVTSCPGVEFRPADDGRTLQVQKGELLLFMAEGNPTTGYNWFARGYDESLLAHDPDRDEYNPSSDLVGSGGTVSICLTAIAAGETPLELVYERPWESGTVEPLQRVNVTVVIPE